MGLVGHGSDSKEFRINIAMSEKQYLIAIARCSETRETVKSQNLARRYELHERRECQIEADHMAEQMQRKTGKTWRGFVESYALVNDRNRL